VSFVNFFFDICKLKLPKDIMERAEAYRKVCESVNYIWPNRDFVMVCARPVFIGRDTNGRLHSEERKAIEYPDGWGLFMLHGVRFEEELWKKVVSGQMSFKEIMAIVDIDQRWVAFKYNPEALRQEKAKLLDKSERGNELYLIEDFFPSAPKAYFLRYTCPSTGRIYFSGIDPKVGEKGKADLCSAWKHWMSEEEYNQLKIET
jgi:hypothetical protein